MGAGSGAAGQLPARISTLRAGPDGVPPGERLTSQRGHTHFGPFGLNLLRLDREITRLG
jgi:hypothetical protein